MAVTPSDPLAEFPAALAVGSGQSNLVYRRLPGQFAVHGPLPDALRSSVARELEEGVAVCRGTPDASQMMGSGATVTPVYGPEPGGAVVVPTGRVFVRFREDVRAEDRREELRRAGYVVENVPPYAPHAAWVQAVEGGPAAALKELATLAALPDVAHVEPELLRERGVR